MKSVVKLVLLMAALSSATAFTVSRAARETLAGPGGGAPRVVPSGPATPGTPSADPEPAPEAPPVTREPSENPEPVRINPDPENPTGRLIEVNIATQRLTAWQDGRVVLRAVISTGAKEFETPTGRWTVLSKERRHWSRSYRVWMPEAMRFYRGYFFHGLPYESDPDERMGAKDLGRPASHGCIRVEPGKSERLFAWAKTGTAVWIH